MVLFCTSYTWLISYLFSGRNYRESIHEHITLAVSCNWLFPWSSLHYKKSLLRFLAQLSAKILQSNCWYLQPTKIAYVLVPLDYSSWQHKHFTWRTTDGQIGLFVLVDNIYWSRSPFWGVVLCAWLCFVSVEIKNKLMWIFEAKLSLCFSIN